ncbi:MAG: alpha-amylase family glycosyl hydrolase [Acidobacteriota bacterium]
MAGRLTDAIRMKRLIILITVGLMLILVKLLPITPGAASTAIPPTLEKIDPPSWWIGHSINPVQVLIQGRGLDNASLRIDTPGVKVVRSSVSAAGNYLIAYLDIDEKQALPGVLTLTVEGAQGDAKINFQLQERPDPVGKYQGFNPDDVIYLIMIDRFSDGDQTNNDPSGSTGFYDRRKPRAYHGGDLQGIIDRLPYLKELGVSAIWITPVYDNFNQTGNDYHGYGAVDFYAVDEHFGDVATLRKLVERAHMMGIKVIQDQVKNHIGPQHPWIDAPPTRHFINGTRQQHLNNVFDIVALTQPNSDPARVEATLRGWFADILPDINQDDPEAAQYLIQNSLWWIGQTGIDGIRADTFPYVARGFWMQWMAAIKRQYPNFTVVGEVFDGRPAVTAFFQGGVTRFDNIDSGLDTVFDFATCFAIRDFITRGEHKLSSVLELDSLYTRPGVLVPFFGNHDIARLADTPKVTPAKQVLAYTYLLTMRGTPQIYYGDEIGMKGGKDPDNRRDFPGGFPGDTRSAFINNGRTKVERRIFNAIRQLLAIRRAQPALRGGETLFLRDSNGLLTYLRTRDVGRVIVAINNNDLPAKWTVKLPAATFAEGTRLIDLLGHGVNVTVRQSKIRLSLPARSAAIYRIS